MDNDLSFSESSQPLLGIAPRWTPLDNPRRLRKDDGYLVRDVNAARYPDHSPEPAVRSLLARDTHFPTDEVDLFACGVTVGNLLRFVLGKNSTFRLVIESIGDTVFFIRRPTTPTSDFQTPGGYGRSFLRSYTTWGAQAGDSESNQRLIKYDFAGFRCLIRFEGDGYLEEKLDQRDLSYELLNLVDLPDHEKLEVKPGGARIPQSAIFGLKTRSTRNKINDLETEMGRLWIRQVPNLVLACHEKGVFDDIQVRDVRDDLVKWETQHARELRKLAVLLGDLISKAKRSTGGRLEVCCQTEQPGILEMREVDVEFPRALPPDLCSLWADSKSKSDPLSKTMAEAQESEGADDENGGIGPESGGDIIDIPIAALTL